MDGIWCGFIMNHLLLMLLMISGQEILLDVNGIYGTSGTPTTVYQRGVNATHMLRTWQYHGVLIEDRLVISYGSKSDYYSSDDELLFDKVLELPSAFSYLKE